MSSEKVVFPRYIGGQPNEGMHLLHPLTQQEQTLIIRQDTLTVAKTQHFWAIAAPGASTVFCCNTKLTVQTVETVENLNETGYKSSRNLLLVTVAPVL
jgi:hypothetical protein